ncbi:MAG: hypothetical protein JO112_01230 [Planctomycetes bacterium]|nr:hypothetical protein [Planctomycetota bacterium]
MSTHLRRRDFLTLTGAAFVAAASFPSSMVAAPGGPSGKKGFGTPIGSDAQWRSRLEALRAKWFYTWGDAIPAGVPEGVEFVPMIWGWSGQDDKVQLLRRQGAAGKVHHLLGFNEPDQHDQSNLTVEKALAVWPKLMETGLPLGSPGCVFPDREWMKQFLRGVQERRLRVDFICVHSYQGPDAKGLLRWLQGIHEMYGGRPLWLTEFAVGDWQARSVQQNRFSPKRIADFMREVLPALEAARFVQRFAWFSGPPDSAALGTSALFDRNGRLTELGEIYRAF